MPHEGPREGIDWFGERLRELREGAGLSQEHLAEQIGVHQTYIYKLEAGKSQPTVARALSLARALGIGIEILLREPGKKFRKK